MKSLLTFLAFITLSISISAQIPEGAVSVTIEEYDKVPLIGVVVKISQNGNYVASGVTDTLGKCRINDLAPGLYQLTAEYLLQREASTLKVVSGKTTDKKLSFQFESTCRLYNYHVTLPSLCDDYGTSVSIPTHLLQNLMP